MKKVEIISRQGNPKTDGLRAMCYMRVCAHKDATDKEILEVCNRENLCGTTGGWMGVVREDTKPYKGEVICDDDPERLHILVTC